jgi:hypothetical protein
MVFLLLGLNVERLETQLGSFTLLGVAVRERNSSIQLPQNLSKLVETLFANDPARRLQRPAREAFSAPRRVTQGDGVRRGVKTDFVRAGNRSGTIRA